MDLQNLKFALQDAIDLIECNCGGEPCEGNCTHAMLVTAYKSLNEIDALLARAQKMEIALEEIKALGIRLGEFTGKNAFDALNIVVGIARRALERP